MPTSCIVEGKVLDFHYKKISDGTYSFYIGHIYIGRVVTISRRSGWAAFSPGVPLTYGFISRFYASQYLLYELGYWKRD